MKYENQRPDLADQIKSLVQSANSVKTVPHGIKTVNPGEGLQLLSGDGSMIFWDWETAHEYDDRIASGQAAIAEAEAALAQTRLDLDAAAGRLDAGEAQLVQAVETANKAQELVTTTAGNLTALETTVGGFADAITASEQKAADALAKSVQAQVSADGKNRITRATSAASQPGTAVGDTHFVMSSMGGGGRVVRQQRWDGSTWQDETVSHEVIASLDLGKATVGELDGGRIAARSLSADRFTVGVAGNLLVDPNFNDATVSGWRLNGRWQWGTTDGETYFRAWADGTLTDMGLQGGASRAPSIPVASGTTYALTLDVKGTIAIYLSIRYANGAVNTPGTSIQTAPHSPTRRAHTFIVTPDDYGTAVAAGTKPVEIQINIRQPSNAPSGSDTTVYSAKFAPRSSTVLIEDGAVTAEKVEAQSVAGAVGRFLTVEAMTGVFTESLTAKDATLLGTTVAQALTVEKLTARNVIVPGTIDVAQLNVTEELSAEVVRTMSLAAKRLVVTENAILNQATVVQSLVTPELIAQKANVETLAARMVSAGAIVAQDSTGSVQINPSGITVRDAAPGSTSYTRQVQVTPAGITGGTRTTPTVNIDGQNNWMIGEFSTAPDKQRVRLRSTGTLAAADFFGSNNTTDHLGIFHQAEAGTNTVSKIIGFNGITQVKGNPGMLLYPFRGEFAFAGRWARDTDTIKLFFAENTAGMAAGGWADFTYTYTTPFTSTYSARFPFLSVETATGRECVAVVTSQTVDKIGIRVVNKSSGPSGAIIVRGVVFNANTQVYSEYW